MCCDKNGQSATSFAEQVSSETTGMLLRVASSGGTGADGLAVLSLPHKSKVSTSIEDAQQTVENRLRTRLCSSRAQMCTTL